MHLPVPHPHPSLFRRQKLELKLKTAARVSWACLWTCGTCWVCWVLLLFNLLQCWRLWREPRHGCLSFIQYIFLSCISYRVYVLALNIFLVGPDVLWCVMQCCWVRVSFNEFLVPMFILFLFIDISTHDTICSWCLMSWGSALGITCMIVSVLRGSTRLQEERKKRRGTCSYCQSRLGTSGVSEEKSREETNRSV